MSTYRTAEGSIQIEDDAVILTFEGAKKLNNPRRLPFSAMIAATLVEPVDGKPGYVRFMMQESEWGPSASWDPKYDPNVVLLEPGETFASAQEYISVLRERKAGGRARFHPDVRIKHVPSPPIAPASPPTHKPVEAVSRQPTRAWDELPLVKVPLLVFSVFMLGFSGFQLFGLIRDIGGDETPSNKYAFDAVYVPTEMGNATPEARFIDDAVSMGFEHSAGASGFPKLGRSICSDIRTGHLSDKEASEIVADEIGTSLAKAHWLVLSARYNFCR
ncbi:hypothetical protein [Prescottella equi]|uniref:DUF732 domain-containing protein n=1 Tax=Rhodococcus hoagii TaxID=43767 RepID=A0AAE5IN84_RHOHA|nr:hypothetical protein [Prescottella equi]ERN47712.1 hypothetical protein H849_01526 [Prescottella equi NBRC 101255 = C 7]MBM4627325.1 hypothetical protein [Prescottella equi]OQQ25398.1 hypothetical protein A6410_19905 [Prescottella equi]ORL25343.1 hypothetical protein A6I89_19740 [Prescottella equi]ORL97970.1 hypothetical protein A5N73_20270 [Prescottella equi]